MFNTIVNISHIITKFATFVTYTCMIMCAKYGRKPTAFAKVTLKFPTMSFSQVVHDLGVLDSELTFSHHIDQVCHSCYYQLRQLRVIACSLTFNAAVSLVHVFVFSCLDYCSSILAGLPGGSDEKVEAGSRGCSTTSRSLTTYLNICGMYCTAYYIRRKKKRGM